MAQLLTSQVSTMEVTDDDPADVHDYEDIVDPTNVCCMGTSPKLEKEKSVDIYEEIR